MGSGEVHICIAIFLLMHILEKKYQDIFSLLNFNIIMCIYVMHFEFL
jgi:hypothetical protein